MSKAYDRIEWTYLSAIMERLGFSRRWIDLIMKCVTTVSFSILFNGEKLEKFKPSRGIRQGDPISPYLFLLCAEGLSCLLNNSREHDMGIIVAKNAPKINHLFFLQMTVFYSSRREQTLRKEFNQCSLIIVMHQANESTMINHQFSLAKNAVRTQRSR